jgi:hypothetical protein
VNNRYSRRTVIAAIDVLEGEWYHADFTAFLMELGPAVYTRVRSEPISLKNRMSDLKQFVDLNPGLSIEGDLLERIIVDRAAAILPPGPEFEWSPPRELKPAIEIFTRALELDGLTVTAGMLRPILPGDIDLPRTESELMRLLAHHGMETAKGHLEQAMDAHVRGNWASANAQIRAFLDGLLDDIAARIDPSAQSLPSGQARRGKLAASGFLSRPSARPRGPR